MVDLTDQSDDTLAETYCNSNVPIRHLVSIACTTRLHNLKYWQDVWSDCSCWSSFQSAQPLLI